MNRWRARSLNDGSRVVFTIPRSVGIIFPILLSHIYPMKTHFLKSICCLTLLLASSLTTFANWAQWRGPNFNGSTDAGKLPTEWSKTKNVSWSTDLPGPSAASPIIWEDHVFISSVDPEADTIHALCYDRNSGKLLWEHQVGIGHRRDNRSDFASNSPATDG